MPVSCYKYGCRVPDPIKPILDQMYLNNRYQNKLIELENQHYERYVALRSALSKPLSDAEARYKDAEDVITKACNAVAEARKQSGSRARVDPALLEAVKAAKQARKIIYEDVKRERALAKEIVKSSPELIKLQETHNDARKAARAECGVYWGTYQLAEDAVEVAKSKKKWPLKFKSSNRDMSVSMQLQKSQGLMTWDRALSGEDTRIQITDLGKKRRGEKVYQLRWRLMSQITQDGKNNPVTGTVEFTMHRPLPAGAIITRVRVKRERIGRHSKWFVLFAFEAPELPKKSTSESGRVAVDLGWRVVNDGLRVAYWLGDDGQSGELILPESLIQRVKKTEDLAAIIDINFNAALATLRQWIAANTIPDWLKEKTLSIHAWKSPGRLAWLMTHWRNNRFDSDADIFSQLEGAQVIKDNKPGYSNWRKQHDHLNDWKSHQRERFSRQRQQLYKNFARLLARKYQCIIVKDTDYSKLAQNQPVESVKVDIAAARHYRFIAAVSEIQSALKLSGAQFVRVDSKHTTQTCSKCGHVNGFDSEKSIHFTCDNCHYVHDQDHNSTINMLKLSEEHQAQAEAVTA